MKGKRDKKAPVKRLKDVLYGPKDSNSFLDDVNRGLVFRSKFENTSQLVQEEPAVKNPLPGVPFHLQDHTVIVDADEIAKANVYKRSLFREPTSTKGTLQKENTIKTQYNLNKVKARRKKKELKDVIYNNQQENPNNVVNKAELSKKNDGFEDNDPEKRVKVIEEILKRNNGFNPIKNLNQNESEVFGTKVNSSITKESQLFQNKNVDRDVRETDNTNKAINKITNLTSNTTASQKKKEDKGKKGNQIEVLNIFDSENEEENLNAKGSVASQNNRGSINSDLINTNGNQHEIANNMNQEISTFDQQNVAVFNNQNMEVYNPSNNQPNYENKEAVYRADEFYSLPPRRPDIWYSPFPVDPQANLGDFDFAPGEEVDNEHISTDQYDNLQSENPYQQSPGDLFSLEQPYFNTPTQHDNHADLREVRYQYDIEGGNKVGQAEIDVAREHVYDSDYHQNNRYNKEHIKVNEKSKLEHYNKSINMSDFINFDYTEASLKNISRNGSKHKHISGSKKVDYRSMDENSGNILEDMAGDYNIKKNHEKSVEIPSKGNVYQDKNKLEEDHLNFNVKEWERYKNDIQYEIEEEYPPNDMIQVNPEDNNSIDSDDDEQKMSAIEWRKFKEDNEYSLDEIDEIKQNEEGSIINSDENQDELDAIEWEKVKNDLYEEEEEVELNENHENQNQNWDVMTSDKEMIDGNRITGVNEVNGLGEIQHNHDTSLSASKRRTSGVISNKSQSLISPSKTGMLVYGKNFSKEKSSDLDNSESNKLSKPRSIIEGSSKLSNKFNKSIEYNSSKEIKMDNHNNSKDKNRSANSSRISERKSLSNNSASFSRREGSELADLIQDNNRILNDDMINEESLEKMGAKIKDKITDKGNDRGSDQESDEFESWMKFKETIDYNIEQANRAINKPAYLPKKPAVKNNSINKETLSSNRKEDTLSQHKTIPVPLKESNLYDHDLQANNKVEAQMTTKQIYNYLEPSPLIYSTKLSKFLGCRVLLKMENTLPGQTHKIRGLMDWVVESARLNGAPYNIEPIEMVISGSPNRCLAGLAAVEIYNEGVFQMNKNIVPPPLSLTAILPHCANRDIIEKLEEGEVKVIKIGESWENSDLAAERYVTKMNTDAKWKPDRSPQTHTMIPFPQASHPLVTKGYNAVGKEIITQLKGKIPDAILCPVGTGSLLAGIVGGISEDSKMGEVPIIAVETNTTDTLHCAIQADKLCKKKEMNLPRRNNDNYEFDNVLSLADPNLNPYAFKAALNHPILPLVISEAMAANAAIRFSEDHYTLVEAASACALAPIYDELLPKLIPTLKPTSTIVIVITGGNCITYSKLKRLKNKFTKHVIQAKSGEEFLFELPECEVKMKENKGVNLSNLNGDDKRKRILVIKEIEALECKRKVG